MDYLHTLWLVQVQTNPDAIAIEDATGSYSYALLAEQASRWSNYLHKLGIGRHNNLVLIADSSFSSIAILIGCSMSGVIFTVIAPEVPYARRTNIVSDLNPAMIVYDKNTLDLSTDQLGVIEKEPIFNRFVIENKKDFRSVVHNRLAQITTDPAYIVFTSGSTGRPKGIVMSHRAIVSFWNGLIEHAKLTSDKRYASLSPLQFDFSLLDIGLCLGSGATLILPNRGLLRKPKILVEQLSKSAITHFSGVPTIWKILLQSTPDNLHKLNKLERILFAGEHFPAENMCAISDRITGVDFYNIYGQSESIACTFHVLSEKDFRFNKAHIPVGHSHKDMELLLIDEQNRPITKAGISGELYLRGTTLFSGYWKQPKQTQQSLVQNPLHDDYVDIVFRSGDICYFDEEGVFYFICRKDNQIKVNGNRVELEEIEAALNRFPNVANSCVLMVDDTLHAALTIKSNKKDNRSEYETSLRTFLNKDLPTYMLPKYYHFTKSIPISENGKNDRHQLLNILGLGM